MNYVVDPQTPYASFSENKFATDYLQFPQHSLVYRAGDCDDLSILYASLLEAVGIETAFITIPGHIYMAFSLDMNPNDASKTFQYEDDLIVINENTWVPIETTLLTADFLKAWQTGAKQWREHFSSDTARFYPVHEAWKLYEPVGIGGDNQQVRLPDRELLISRYTDELGRFIEREIQPQVESLQRRIAGANNSPKLINRLGTLYARFGLYERAQTEFLRIAGGRRPYVPAIVNLGNVSMIAGDLRKAEQYYQTASNYEPDNAHALIGLARVKYELGDYSRAGELHSQSQMLDPDLSRRFAYLSGSEAGTDRANSVGTTEVMVWAEN
jgi:tetratricopeptide (TPR) repeat protein